MNKRRLKKLECTCAITLISLIITIIILMILAGIVINLSIGEKGLFNKAKYAKEKYLNAESIEEQQLKELYEELGILGDLPENTKETTAGTIVKMPNNWEKYTPSYVTDGNGEEIISSKKVASVYAVSSGNMETIPIPYGFYYVGGNLKSGVVISDNKADKNKYAGQADVPNGIEIKDGNFVDILKGNQFVWIPCTEKEYKKSEIQGNVKGISNCYFGVEINSSELAQIKKYGGFYIGRYEAGLPTNQDGFTGEDGFISSLGTTSNWLDYFSSQYNSIKTPISKAGREPWNFINYDNSWASAQKMYDTASVVSGLVTGTQWDVMTNKIVYEDSNKSIINSKSWGNYNIGEEFTYNGKAAEIKPSENRIYGYSNIQENAIKSNNIYKLLTTGASEHNKAYNLYDVAGSLWEWTEESTAYNTIQTLATHRVLRGGCMASNSELEPAGFRHGYNVSTDSHVMFGFRIVLYIV